MEGGRTRRQYLSLAATGFTLGFSNGEIPASWNSTRARQTDDERFVVNEHARSTLSGTDVPSVVGVARNVSGDRLKFGTVEIDYLDADGRTVGRGIDIVEDVKEGEGAAFDATFYSEEESADAIDGYDVRAIGEGYDEDERAFDRGNDLVSVAESEVEDGSPPTLRGTAEIGGDDRLAIAAVGARVFDGEDTILGQYGAIARQVDPGEEWTFEAELGPVASDDGAIDRHETWGAGSTMADVPAGAADDSAATTAFQLRVDSIDECSTRCRDVTTTLYNTGTNTHRDVEVATRIYTGDREIWRDDRSVGTLAPSESLTTTERISLDLGEALSVLQNDGRITIHLLVQSDVGSQLFIREETVG